ncbi:MAG: hypothetical protein ABJB74_00665 [Gemmatimonas sp.]
MRSILHAATFVDVTLQAVREPVYYGPEVERAFEFVSRFASVISAVNSQTAHERARTHSRLRDTMAAHRTSDGVWFDARAWIVTAHRGL